MLLHIAYALPYAYSDPLCEMQHGPIGGMLSCRVDCCLYAVNMGYHSSVGNTTAAVTTDNTSAIAIACLTTSTVQWQTADLAVTTASSPGAGNVSTIYDVTNSGGNDTTYVAKVVLEPSYQVGSGLLASRKPETIFLRSACHAMPLLMQLLSGYAYALCRRGLPWASH